MRVSVLTVTAGLLPASKCPVTLAVKQRTQEHAMDQNTPVIIGVGEASERIDAPDYKAMSPAELSAAACAAALADANAAKPLAPLVDVMAAIRQFEISGARAVP